MEPANCNGTKAEVAPGSNLCDQLSAVHLSNISKGVALLDSSRATVLDTPTPVVPLKILQLSNKELRSKLVSLGEQPGPITDATRSAYQLYLAKIQAGVQPSGNRGFKGQFVSGISISWGTNVRRHGVQVYV